MSDEKREQVFGSMFLRRISGQKLISSPIALEIARLVLKEQSGQGALEANEPLTVAEDGDDWIVLGNAPSPAPFDASGLKLEGPFKMRLSQFDGQILDCVFVVTMPRAATIPPKSAE